MHKYKQKVKSIKNAFNYEYWWVINDNAVEYRLMQVRIPPKYGACSDFNYEFYNLECLGRDYPVNTIHTEKEMNKWSWVKHIEQPIKDKIKKQ